MNKIISIGNIKDAGMSKAKLDSLVNDTLKFFGIDKNEVEIWFASKDEIQKLNNEHRYIDKPTDVLSFPQIKVAGSAEPTLGSLVISKEIVEEKDESMTDVIKHGLLHLIGYDHEKDEEKWDEAAQKIGCKL